MRYFIEDIKYCGKTNKKGETLRNFIWNFRQLIVPDDLSLDAMKAEIELFIEELNRRHPRSIPFCLVTDARLWYIRGFHWSVQLKDRPNAFIGFICFKKVLGTYHYSLHPEKAADHVPEIHAQSSAK